jgi:hypothetical protein
MRRSGVRIPLPPVFARSVAKSEACRCRSLWRRGHFSLATLIAIPHSTSSQRYEIHNLSHCCQHRCLPDFPPVAQLTDRIIEFGLAGCIGVPSQSASSVSGNCFSSRSENKAFTINGKEATRVFKVTNKTTIMKGVGAGT